MRYCLLGLVLNVAAFGVQAGAVLDSAKNQLEVNAYVAGDFTQQRYLKGFARPLVARGEFSYWQQGGLYWELQTPFHRATTYGPSDTIHWSSDGKAARVVKGDIVQKLVSQIILAMLSADAERLAEQFHISDQPRAEGWAMVLRPKRSAVAQAVQRIDVIGKNYLQQVDLIAANGDKTVITFANTAGAQRPPKEKCPLFFAQVNQVCQ